MNTQSLFNRRGRVRFKRGQLLQLIEQPTSEKSQFIREVLCRIIITSIDSIIYYRDEVIEYRGHSVHFDSGKDTPLYTIEPFYETYEIGDGPGMIPKHRLFWSSPMYYFKLVQ